MSSFKAAIGYVMRNEGGLSNHPLDPGGITKYGVTLPVLRDLGVFGDIDGDGDIDHEDIRAMTTADAERVYENVWWNRYNYGRISSQIIATKVLDMSVNFGPRVAHMIAQRACNGVSRAGLKVDGVLGPISIAAINAAREDRLLMHLCVECGLTYRRIIEAKPDLAAFEAGWMNRAYREPAA